jgi:hypothetical protein
MSALCQKRITRSPNLLSSDVVGASHITPKVNLTLEQCACSLGRFLVRRVEIHPAVDKSLAELGVGKPAACQARCWVRTAAIRRLLLVELDFATQVAYVRINN